MTERVLVGDVVRVTPSLRVLLQGSAEATDAYHYGRPLLLGDRVWCVEVAAAQWLCGGLIDTDLRPGDGASGVLISDPDVESILVATGSVSADGTTVTVAGASYPIDHPAPGARQDGESVVVIIVSPDGTTEVYEIEFSPS